MGLSKKLGWVAMVVVVVSVVAVSFTEAAEQDCANKLVPCFPYLNSTTKPPDVCCDPIKETVSKQLDCLCNLYNTPGFLASVGLNITQALYLTQSCGVPIQSAQCNITGAMPPSPQSLPPPPGVPGSDNGSGAKMIVWTEISTLLIFLASMMFY